MTDKQPASRVRVIPIEWVESKKTLTQESLPYNDPPFSPGEMILANSVFSALLSGLSGLSQEIQLHFEAFSKGEISGTEYAARIAKAGSERAAFGGAKAVAAFSMQEVVKAMSDKWGRELFKRFARSNVMTMLAFGAVDQSIDTYKYAQGDLSLRNYKVNSAANAGSASGAVAGGAAGALLGSVVPGLGTFLGATIGGYFGSYGGSLAARSFAESWFPEEETAADPSEETPPAE